MGGKYQSFAFVFILLIFFRLSIPHVTARPLNNLGLHEAGEVPAGGFLDSSRKASKSFMPSSNVEGHKYDNVFRTLLDIMNSGPSNGGEGH